LLIISSFALEKRVESTRKIKSLSKSKSKTKFVFLLLIPAIINIFGAHGTAAVATHVAVTHATTAVTHQISEKSLEHILKKEGKELVKNIVKKAENKAVNQAKEDIKDKIQEKLNEADNEEVTPEEGTCPNRRFRFKEHSAKIKKSLRSSAKTDLGIESIFKTGENKASAVFCFHGLTKGAEDATTKSFVIDDAKFGMCGSGGLIYQLQTALKIATLKVDFMADADCQTSESVTIYFFSANEKLGSQDVKKTELAAGVSIAGSPSGVLFIFIGGKAAADGQAAASINYGIKDISYS